MNQERLADLEKQYQMLQKQLSAKEKAKILAPYGEQERIQQQIDEVIQPQLKDWKQRYADALAEAVEIEELTEAQAEIVVGELVEEVQQAKPKATTERQTEILEEILAELSKPEIPATTKVKWAIKSTPPFVEVGVEGERELKSSDNFTQRHFPTYSRWLKKAKKFFPPA